MTPEGKVKQAVVKYLKEMKAWYHLPVSLGMGQHGIPDIVGCHNGRFFAIEVKAPGRRGEANRGASGLQVLQMDKIRTAGGFTMVFDGEGEDWFILREFLEA